MLWRDLDCAPHSGQKVGCRLSTVIVKACSRRSTLTTFMPAAGDHVIDVFITSCCRIPSQGASPPAHHRRNAAPGVRSHQESIRPGATSGAKPCFLSSLRISFTAAVLSRRRCTSKSRTSPSSSTATARTAGPRSLRPSHRNAIAALAAGVDGEVLGRTTVRTSRPIAAPFRRTHRAHA